MQARQGAAIKMMSGANASPTGRSHQSKVHEPAIGSVQPLMHALDQCPNVPVNLQRLK